MSKKVLFILPSLEAGGAERIITFVSQNLNPRQFDCRLLVIGNKIGAAYSIEKVQTKFLNKKRVLVAIPSIIAQIRKSKPDIVLSSIGHVNTLMGLISPFFLKTKFIIREASVVSAYKEFEKKNSLYDFLAKKSFPKVDAVICQSTDMAEDFANIYKIPKKKLFIINNPITRDKAQKSNEFAGVGKRFITIGRLGKEKGHERLLRILSGLNQDFSYTIIGKGPEENQIREIAKELGLENKIEYLEFTNNVYEYLTNNDLFLQGSYVEGFPNVVLESCSVGTPVIAFNVPGGTKEIIEHGVNGYLVDSEEEFRYYLTENREWKRQTVIDSVYEKFSKDKILGLYEKLLDIL